MVISRNPETFFISDTHFNHHAILTFETYARPFKTIEEHNEYLVEQWNKVVRPIDIVWHLGDVYFNSGHSYVPRLNGRKKLVMGNHDRLKYIAPYFEDVFGAANWKDRAILTHVPIHPNQLESRFKLNIHGHLHHVPRLLYTDSYGDTKDRWYFNVCCDHIGFKPIHWEEIKRVL
jgi:calcineurin-like phosphoesterase family protein